jgi:diaminohydroxyphosphoribosylaminopyrimidine deaminase/5-amino-6-(5-phosphoribosylamino)uracil reductase
MQIEKSKKSMKKDELYMQRCFELARRGLGAASPNPLVGAVLVHEDQIIGEGYHEAYGSAHAEVNTLRSAMAHRHLFSKSKLYVSLEPCCFYGKTPACTNLIIENRIPEVIISALDLTPEVNGQGVRILEAAGVNVRTGILREEGEKVAAARNTFVSQQRPYTILKFAQTKNGYIGKKEEQVWISNTYTKRLVHKWRAEVDAILVGTNTARLDNPSLTTRYYFGKSPLRIVLDRAATLPKHLHLWDDKATTLVVSEQPTHPFCQQVFQHAFDQNLLPHLLHYLYEQKIGNLLVEGGAHLLNSFVEKALWDEARVLTSSTYIHEGVPAPRLPHPPKRTFQVDDNQLDWFY